jgi:hypothetical protein
MILMFGKWEEISNYFHKRMASTGADNDANELEMINIFQG